MAKLGLEYLYFLEDGTSKTKIQIAAAIKADVKINVNDLKLYADNTIKESTKEFTDGTITLETDDLSVDTVSTLLAHSKDTTTSVVTCKASDIAPYGKVGFIYKGVKSGVTYYRGVVLSKVQFSEPDTSNQTSGQNTSYGTSTIVGTIFKNDSDEWKKYKEVTTLADAKTFVDTELTAPTE